MREVARQEEMRTLYICYFGLREPLVQTQVLPYLRELSDAGVRIHLLTFEPDMRRRWSEQELEDEQARLRGEGIEWFYLPYHKRPTVPATVFDIFAGAWFAGRHVRRARLDVLHARAHIPLAMALLARAFSPARLVFDLRGLMADEYVDAGIWTQGSLRYRAVKWLERTGLRRADQIVVLTRRLRDWLIAKESANAERIMVVPCCVNLMMYAAASSSSQGTATRDDRFEIVYAGSVTGLYMLEEMGRFFVELQTREPRAFLRILTKSPHEEAAAILRSAGVDRFEISTATAAEVPSQLRRARLGLSFRKPAFSQIAASPTKIAEYLAAGVPVVSNAGIGDVDCLLKAERVGVLVKDLSPEEFARCAAAALMLAAEAGIAQRCAAVARTHFDLSSVGGARYIEVYRHLREGQKLLKPH